MCDFPKNIGAEGILRFADQLEADFGWRLVVGDPYGLLPRAGLGGLRARNRWRENAYCLSVKQNPRLHKRCVHLREDAYLRLLSDGQAREMTCYCGVREFVVPVILRGKLLLTVCASEFCGTLRESVLYTLSRQIGRSAPELRSLRERALLQGFDDALPAMRIYLGLLAALLCHALQSLPEAELSPYLPLPGRSPLTCLVPALDYIRKNATAPISVRDVADACFVSPSHLQHLFSAARGHGIATEIRNARLAIAAELLRTTCRQVKDIAFSCGFITADYFSTAFRAHYGCTPLAYRNQPH